MSLSNFLSTFGVIFLAELGDKTQLTAMALAARFPWKRVFVGLAGAFVVLNLAAVAVGRVLFELVPLNWIKLASGLLFLVFGVLALRGEEEDDDEQGPRATRARGAMSTAFVLILFAELGDKTQLVTASLAAQHASPVAVFTGSTLALWSVSLIGILVGRQLTRVVPLRTIQKLAGLLFLVFAAVMLVQSALGLMNGRGAT